MPFSVVMLISRSDQKFLNSIRSVASYEPDEFLAFIDTTKSDMSESFVEGALKDCNATIHKQLPSLSSDKHENIVHNYHRAMLTASKEWIIKFDDDDQMTGSDRRDLIALHGEEGIGIIHGDKIVNYPHLKYLASLQIKMFLKSLIKPKLWHGGWPDNYRNIPGKIYGGTALIRRKAFHQIHPLLDHGYFYDWKTFYWIMRKGWKTIYVPEVLFLQNVNAYVPKERLKQWGTFPQLLREMDAIEI